MTCVCGADLPGDCAFVAGYYEEEQPGCLRDGVPIPDPEPVTESVGRRIQLVRMSRVESRRIMGLHGLRVPFGKVTVLAGEPKLGKSQYALLLAAEQAKVGKRTLIVTVEDDPEDTIDPRLRALGLSEAERDLIDIVRISVRDDEGREWTDVVSIPDDLRLIEEALVSEGHELLVIDPIGAHLSGRVNSWNEGELRRALGPVQALAANYGVAALVVAHLNKAVGTSALYRVAGSIGMVGAARSVLFFANDPDNPDGDTRLLAHMGNFKPQPTLRYRMREILIEAADGGPRIETSRLEEMGEADYSFDDVGSSAGNRSAVSKADTAETLLRAILANGEWYESDAVKQELVAADYSEPTVKRAAKALGVQVERRGFPSATWWRLPVGSAPVGSGLYPKSEPTGDGAQPRDSDGPEPTVGSDSRCDPTTRNGRRPRIGDPEYLPFMFRAFESELITEGEWKQAERAYKFVAATGGSL